MQLSRLREAWGLGEIQRSWQTKKWSAKIYKVMKAQIIAFTKSFRERPIWTQDNIDRFITIQPIGEVIWELYKDVGVRQARMSYRAVTRSVKDARLGFDQDFINQLSEILDEDFLSLITNITDNTKRIIIDIIEKGIQNGEGIEVIARNLITSGITRARGRMIARTETNNASNLGRIIGAKKTGLLLNKFWSSAPNSPRTRGNHAKDKADHAHMNGQMVGMDELFTDPRDGAKLDHPGDRKHGAPAETTINCRCVVTFEAVKDQYGLPIRINESMQR